MKVATWNVNCAVGSKPSKTTALVRTIVEADADVVLLQEVAFGETSGQLEDALSQTSLPHYHHASTPDSPRKQYGCAIASRWPLTPAAPHWAPDAPFPQLLARATVHRPEQAFDVVSAHAPNGSRNGWRKIDTIEALLAGVAERERPLIVGGDFNEPVEWLPGKSPKSAARRKGAGDSDLYAGHWKRTDEAIDKEETHPRTRWQAAVEALLLGTESGLWHAFRTLHPNEVPTTHVAGGTERFFDHLLISAELDLVDAGYNHDWRTNGPSDHSGGWVVLR